MITIYCPEHPKYEAKKAPASHCFSCWTIWEALNHNGVDLVGERRPPACKAFISGTNKKKQA